MKIDLNKTISFTIIALGFLLFFSNITNNSSVACISIIGMFLFWILWNKVAGSFILNYLIYLISIVGLVVSISILVFYGIEPIGTRNGTLMRFHSDAIALSMLTFFVTLLPYLILNMKIQLPINKLTLSLKPAILKQRKTQKPARDQYIVNDENWELVSEQDALSGNYYID
jgi:hypothetical protein